jgi:hypothetical protein
MAGMKVPQLVDQKELLSAAMMVSQKVVKMEAQKVEH